MAGPNRIRKVLFMDEQGNRVGEWSSKQLAEDPFADHYGRQIKTPPYSLEQLAYLAETFPVHGTCLEQKAMDVVGEGWQWTPVNDEADEEQRDMLDAWLHELAGNESTTIELLQQCWLDFETLGQGYLEVARDVHQVARALYYVPSHTVRVHAQMDKLVQLRDSRMVWFRRWGSQEGYSDQPINVASGHRLAADAPASKRANDLLVFRKPARRSTFYGIPQYVSAVGYITLGLAARDFNILFFQNRREPRWAVIIQGVDDTEELEKSLQEAMQAQLREPHRNLILPVEGQPGANVVTFQKLSEDSPDAAFTKLRESCMDEVLIAHRMPRDRVGIGRVGALGGSAAEANNRIYKEGVVQPAQAVLASRWNRFILREFPRFLEMEAGKDNERAERVLLRLKKAKEEKKAKTDAEVILWRFAPREFDISEEESDMAAATKGFKDGILTLDEAREKIKREPVLDYDPETGEEAEELPPGQGRGGKFFWELQPAGANPGEEPPEDEDAESQVQDGLFAKAEDYFESRMAFVDEEIHRLLTGG